MIKFESFCEEIRNNIKAFLPVTYENAEVSVMDYQKLKISAAHSRDFSRELAASLDSLFQ